MNLVKEFETDFSGLDLSGVDFRGYYSVNNETILRNANFRGCNLADAEFGSAILDGADFTGANLQRASFVTASLRDAIFTESDVNGARFYQSDLSGARLAGADLSTTSITGCTLHGADLSRAVVSGGERRSWSNDFAEADLTDANLSGLELHSSSFRNAMLRRANLSATDLTRADFTGADLSETNLDNAIVAGADFRGARGLSEAERRRLESQAQHWKVELGAFARCLRFPREITTLPAVLLPSFGLLGALSVILLLTSLALIVFILAQIRKRPRLYLPYVFIAIIVVDQVIEFTGAVYWEDASQFFLFVLALLSAATFVEYRTRKVDRSHVWTAASTAVIAVSYWIVTAFAMAVASV